MPDRGLDDRVFVVNDMATIIELIQGAEMVTFHGTPEWALDYVYLGEAVMAAGRGTVAREVAPSLAHERLPVYDLLFMDGTSPAGSSGGTSRWRSLPKSASDAYARGVLTCHENA